uniref:Uncharacterized protein n=1 Tax=Loxodonta africana TaxID=9785 RepID=G3T088_LOXAF
LTSLPIAILMLVNASYKRGFYSGDDTIWYPYHSDTITQGFVAGVTITTTAVLLRQNRAYLGVAYSLAVSGRSNLNNYMATMFKVLGIFLFGASVSQSLTDLAKYMIGHLQPIFLAICDPYWSHVNFSVYMQLEKACRGSLANVTKARCVQGEGHSSFGMYFMVFLVVSLFSVWKWVWLLQPTVQLFLVAFALYIGYTHVSDQKRH